MPIVVSTADQKPVLVKIDLQGVSMDETAARKFAQDLRSDLRWKLGLGGGDDEEMLVVEVSVDPSPPSLPVTPESPDDSPAESPAKATAAEIAAMTTDQYKAAKAAGRV